MYVGIRRIVASFWACSSNGKQVHQWPDGRHIVHTANRKSLVVFGALMVEFEMKSEFAFLALHVQALHT